MANESDPLEILSQALNRLSSARREMVKDMLATVSLRALETVDEAFKRKYITHKIPLQATESALWAALTAAETQEGSSVQCKVLRLQLHLINHKRAKPAATSVDFEVFREIARQHHIEV